MGSTRRERQRAATEAEIRGRARKILVDEGAEAVTLRAIAKEVGVTAPALYRYFGSREELLHGVCADICADLTTALAAPEPVEGPGAPDGMGGADGMGDPDDVVQRVLSVCRRFRSWSLDHPAEFGLVFATAKGDVSMSRIFLTVVAELVSADVVDVAGPNPVPPELLDDLAESRRAMIAALGAAGVAVDEDAVTLDSVHWILQWWIRLYGHVALEVFGRFPFEVAGAERLFESMLTGLARESGLSESGASRA